MVEIKPATKAHIEVLAVLGRITYRESHGHFIEDKNDLFQYLNQAFSTSQITEELNAPNTLFYLVYVDDLPVGYAKVVLHAQHKSIPSSNSLRLERIYMLEEFIPMRIGQQLMTFIEEQTKAWKQESMWLSVYFKNHRAIRFYEKNGFEQIGELDFPVNGKNYKNMVFSKHIETNPSENEIK